MKPASGKGLLAVSQHGRRVTTEVATEKGQGCEVTTQSLKRYPSPMRMTHSRETALIHSSQWFLHVLIPSTRHHLLNTPLLQDCHTRNQIPAQETLGDKPEHSGIRSSVGSGIHRFGCVLTSGATNPLSTGTNALLYSHQQWARFPVTPHPHSSTLGIFCVLILLQPGSDIVAHTCNPR
jgi:hypothetical protein